mmetsp:Transcript_10283/g.12059  ORF Transcript_10283/g.12059 Transcript_10283/m.12059 type:complete len:85 (+) Transcript_10283:1718-1972(+)
MFRSRLNAFTMTNTSSRPIPSKTNGRRVLSGPENIPKKDAKPIAAAVLKATSMMAQRDTAHLDPLPQNLPKVAPTKMNETMNEI